MHPNIKEAFFLEQQCGQAAGGAGGQGSLMGMLFPLAIFVVIFYFFIIRPQKKRQRAQDELLSSLSRGDQVVTIGGFFGTIREVRDDSLVVEIADGVKVRLLKSAVASKRAPATQAPKEEPAREKEEEKN